MGKHSDHVLDRTLAQRISAGRRKSGHFSALTQLGP